MDALSVESSAISYTHSFNFTPFFNYQRILQISDLTNFLEINGSYRFNSAHAHGFLRWLPRVFNEHVPFFIDRELEK